MPVRGVRHGGGSSAPDAYRARYRSATPPADAEHPQYQLARRVEGVQYARAPLEVQFANYGPVRGHAPEDDDDEPEERSCIEVATYDYHDKGVGNYYPDDDPRAGAGPSRSNPAPSVRSDKPRRKVRIPSDEDERH